MSTRAWNGLVFSLVGLLVVTVTVLVLVVDPRQTVSRDLASLYRAMGPGGWVGLGVTVLVWAGGVAALTAGALLVSDLGWRGRGAVGGPAAWAARLAPGLGVLGLVAAGSLVVPGFPVGLAFFTAAEELGTAPVSGSLSPQAEAVGAVGVVLLVAAVVSTLVSAALGLRRAGRAPAGPAAGPHGSPDRPPAPPA